MKRFPHQKLVVQLFLAIAMNVILSGLMFILLINIADVIYFDKADSTYSKTGVLVFFLIFFLTVIFSILSFTMMMNYKLKQLTNLAKEIDVIASGELGKQVVIKGHDEIASVGKSVNQMSVQLKKLFEEEREHEKERIELISNLSHDLRTPLTSIKGYVQLLIDSPEYVENSYLQIIERKTTQIEQLLDQLLEVDRLDRGRVSVDYKAINLSLLTFQIVHEYKPLFESRSLCLSTSTKSNLYIKGDIEGTGRVCQNLISNALKYAPMNTDVEIKIKEDHEFFSWEITNETDEKTLNSLDKLFVRTFRVDDSRSLTPGEGLGLSIARQLMLLNGGELFAERTEEKKIRFRAVFPKLILEKTD